MGRPHISCAGWYPTGVIDWNSPAKLAPGWLYCVKGKLRKHPSFVAQMCQRHIVAQFVASAKLLSIREARIGPTRQNMPYLYYSDRPDMSEHTLFILLNIY